MASCAVELVEQHSRAACTSYGCASDTAVVIHKPRSTQTAHTQLIYEYPHTRTSFSSTPRNAEYVTRGAVPSTGCTWCTRFEWKR